MGMTENAWAWTISTEGCGSFHADVHKTTCMRMAENPSDDPIMHEHLCDENAWEWLIKYWTGPYTRRNVWVILGWCTLYDMHDAEWECIRLSLNGWTCMWRECMRRTENAWEWPIFKEGCGGHSMRIYIIQHRLCWMGIHQDYFIMDEHECDECDENAWEWLRMSEKDSYPRTGCGSFHALHKTTCIIMNGNASDYPIIHEHVYGENAWEWLRMCENGPHSGRGVWVILGRCTLYDMHDAEWECIRLPHNGWTWMWW